MKKTLEVTLEGILKLRDVAELEPSRATELSLFTFVEQGEVIEDIISDLEEAIELIA